MSLFAKKWVRIVAFAVSAVFGGILLTGGVVAAATTISTDISTGGMLSVTGTSTLMGNVGIGTPIPAYSLDIQSASNNLLNLVSSTTAAFLQMTSYRNSSITHAGIEGLGARGTELAPSAVQSNDALLSIRASGYGTTGFENTNDDSAAIDLDADENYTDSAAGGKIVFWTRPNGTTGFKDIRMVIKNSGNVGIGTTNPQNILDVNGAEGIGAYAGNNTAPSNGLIVSGSVGVGTSTPVANFQVANGSNATTTAEFGSAGQNKGSCLKLYRTDGSAIYAYVAAGATTFTLTTAACANVSNF